MTHIGGKAQYVHPQFMAQMNEEHTALFTHAGQLRKALEDLQTSPNCWCPVAQLRVHVVGHTAACKQAQQALGYEHGSRQAAD